MTASSTRQSPRAIRVSRVAELVGASKPTVRRWVQTVPGFPKPFHLSPGVTAWNEAEIIAWLEAKMATRVIGR